MLAGLEEVNGGRILIGDRDVTNLSPKDRDVAMVFQNYALYPHMTVADNMGFALKIAGVDKGEIRKRVEEAAKILDLTPYLDRKPKALSGGQRQRVAMGRAIVRSPQVFLMDEPLSNLDAKLRVQTRTQIASLQRRLGVTTVYVTHDQVEAMTMGDRVAVLKDGILQQCDSPRRMYDHPANVFVAGFIGSPAMNLMNVARHRRRRRPRTATPCRSRARTSPASARTSPWASVPRTSSSSSDGLGHPGHGRRRRGARRRRLHLRLHRAEAARGHRRERRRRAVHRARRRSPPPGEGREDLPQAEAGPRARLQLRVGSARRRLTESASRATLSVCRWAGTLPGCRPSGIPEPRSGPLGSRLRALGVDRRLSASVPR